MEGSTSNQKTYLGVAIAAAAVFFILAVVFGISWNKSAKKGSTAEAKAAETEQLRAELEKDYYTALSDLEEMRGSNEELNSLIEKQKEELSTQKAEIDRLIKNGRSLSAVRKELNALKAKAQQYVAQINQLTEEKELLIEEKTKLTEEKQVLETSLQESQATAELLSTEKTQLESDKMALEETAEQLSKKVNIASVIKVTDLEVTGLKLRNSGKAVKKNNAKNIDQMQVCFNTTENAVAEGGSELFFVRIIGPGGVTLSIESLGSGVFQNNNDEEAYPYTRTAEIAYDNDIQKVCSVWAPGQAFEAGDYEVEIYNKGYLAGKTTFKLK